MNCTENKKEIDQEWLNNQIKDFNIDDYLVRLHDKNKIFYAIVSIPTIYFTNSLDTLGVYLEKESNEIVLGINPEFFFTKTSEEKLFLLCHEAMHVLLNHVHLPTGNHALANIAKDIVINESLLNDYYFRKSEMKNLFSEMITVAKVFSPEEIAEHNIVKNASWTYYYELLNKLKPEMGESLKPCQHGVHGELSNLSEDTIDDLLKDVVNRLSKEELHNLKSSVVSLSDKAGDGSEGRLIKIMHKKLTKKVDWKTILKQAMVSIVQRQEVEKYSFARVARRNSLLEKGLMIPSLNITYNKKVAKHNVAFFLDVSGSCLNFSQKFFDFAKTLPTDTCNITFFSFDSQIYNVDIKNGHLFGGGGTNFDIIEKKCSQMDRYPDIVFLVTDGEGNAVTPRHPDRWVWFLDGSKDDTYIHAKSKKYELDLIY